MKRPAEDDDDDYHSHEPAIIQHIDIVNGTIMSSLIDKVAILDCGAQYGKVIYYCIEG